MLPRVLACTLLCAAAFATSAAPTWRALPGAPDLSVDLTSIRHDGTRVVAWLRWWGRPAPGLVPARDGAPPANAHRTTGEVSFDCNARTATLLGTTTYDARGKALTMSTIPGPRVSVVDGDLGWAYDALCETLRSGSRF